MTTNRIQRRRGLSATRTVAVAMMAVAVAAGGLMPGAVSLARAQEPAAPASRPAGNSAGTESKATGTGAGAETKPKAKPKLSQEELEARFKATLTKATMSGRWCGIVNGKLTPEKEDKYTIVSVAKLGGEAWIINARVQYGTKDFVAPIPVMVKWAGDTPVITLDDVGFPGGQTYSARVLIYDKTYAGTWSGGDHGGLMNGVITNE